MKKLLDIGPYFANTHEPSFQLLDLGNKQSLEKTAATIGSGAYKYASTMSPKEGHTYILVIAMGAFEYYGPNKNSDGFSEKDLYGEKQYLNFETKYVENKTTGDMEINDGALFYKHHKNKVAKGHPWFGVVHKAFYNLRMHRVELIIDIIHSRPGAMELVDKVHSGGTFSVSMGVNIPYDECHYASISIKTADGEKPLGDITLEDKVLTHKGNFKNVTKLIKNPSPTKMISSRATGDFNSYVCTGNHPVFSIKRDSVFYKSKGRLPNFLELASNSVVVDIASNLSKGDYLLRPIRKLSGEVTIRKGDAYILGFYLGDGHLTWLYDEETKERTVPRTIDLTIEEKDRSTLGQRLVEICMEYQYDFSIRRCGKRTQKDGTHVTINAFTFSIRSRELALEVLNTFGTLKDKCVPECVYSWDANLVKTFVGGYVDADGCYRKHGKEVIGLGSLTTTSILEHMSRGFQDCFLALGMSANLREDKIDKDKVTSSFANASTGYVLNIAKSHAIKLDGFSVKVTEACKKYSLSSNQNSDNMFINYEGQPFWAMKLREVSEIDSTEEFVYNISVEDDESYVADNFLTHNCSVCHNQAKKIEQYCDHLKYELGNVRPDGTIIYAINGGYDYKKNPKALNFFDISYVFRPADKVGYMLKKVAMELMNEAVTGSAAAYQKIASLQEKSAALLKMSEITKYFEGQPFSSKDNHELKVINRNPAIFENVVSQMQELSPEHYEKLKKYPMGEILTSLSDLGIMITTPEFVKMVVYKKTGKHICPEMLKQICKDQSKIFEELADNPEMIDDLQEKMTMLKEASVNQEICDIVCDIKESRDLASNFNKLAAVSFLRSNLGVHDKGNPWGDGLGMHHTEGVRDPETGKHYTTSMGAVDDAKRIKDVKDLTKLVGGAAVLAGTYAYLRSMKGIVAPAVGIGALALGAKHLYDKHKGNQATDHYVTDSGMKIPKNTAMFEKQSAFEGTATKFGPKARTTATFGPGLASFLGSKYYENRLKSGTAGTYRTDLEKHMDNLGRAAYEHPVLTTAAGMTGGHLGLNALSAARKLLGK